MGTHGSNKCTERQRGFWRPCSFLLNMKGNKVFGMGKTCKESATALHEEKLGGKRLGGDRILHSSRTLFHLPLPTSPPLPPSALHPASPWCTAVSWGQQKLGKASPEGLTSRYNPRGRCPQNFVQTPKSLQVKDQVAITDLQSCSSQGQARKQRKIPDSRESIKSCISLS